MKINYFIKSFWDITKHIIFARRARVLFYYPQHFNRSANGTNPFFDALLETCEKNDISYKLIEEPDWGTDKPRNPKALKGDVLYLLILVLRKMVRCLRPGKPFYLNEAIVARILNILTFGRLLYSKYISISGSLNELFLALNPKGQVFEMQHGVVFAGKDAFFEPDGSLHPAYKNPNFHLLFWGEGYRQSVIRGHEEELEHRTHVVGYPISAPQSRSEAAQEKKHIAISLQFTADWNASKREYVKQLLIDFLEQIKDAGYSVLLKHHPRYNNIINLDDIYERFDFVRETKVPLNVLVQTTWLHITFDSTTAFEFADWGIPTCFLNGGKYPLSQNIYYKDYNYPLFCHSDITESIHLIQTKQKENATIVKDWFNAFYSPFDTDAFFNLI